MAKVRVLEAFYSEAQGRMIDVVTPGLGIGTYTSRTLAQHIEADASIVQISQTEAMDRIDARLITEPKEIEHSEWDYLLNVLPPQNWHKHGGGETFQLSEAYDGRVTVTLGRVGQRYFKWRDRIGTDYTKLIDKAKAVADTTSAEAV